MTLLRTLLLGLCLVGCLALQAQYAPTDADSDKALLWQIVTEDGQDTSYLYGTIHMIDAESFFITESTKRTFGESRTVVMEVDMQEMSNPMIMFQLLPAMMMPAGTTLKDLLDEKDYERVSAAFKEKLGPMSALLDPDRMKPIISSQMLSLDGGGAGLFGGGGDEGMKSYEMEFMKMAQQSKKEMGGLETIQFQMSLFDSIPYTEQAKMLVDAVDAMEAEANGEEVEDAAGSLDALVKLYTEQDVYGLQTMIAAESEGVGNFEDQLLTKRNENWIPKIGDYMSKGKTFFAVGAGHLAGEKGVIALLRKEGYQVTPMK